MLRVKWGKRAFRIFVRQWKTKHPSQPYNFYSGHPTLRWPAFFLPRARMRWAFFKKKLSPFTTLVYKGIAAIWRFTKVSHCFHTQNKVWARGCVARERSWYGDSWKNSERFSKNGEHLRENAHRFIARTTVSWRGTAIPWLGWAILWTAQCVRRLWKQCETSGPPFRAQEHPRTAYLWAFSHRLWKVKAFFWKAFFSSAMQTKHEYHYF